MTIPSRLVNACLSSMYFTHNVINNEDLIISFILRPFTNQLTSNILHLIKHAADLTR